MTNKQTETLYNLMFTKKKVTYEDLVDAFAAVGQEMLDNNIIHSIDELSFSKMAEYIDRMYGDERYTLAEGGR